MKLENNINNILYIIFYSILPVISTMLVTIVFLPFSNLIGYFEIVLTYMTMGLSFGIIPMFFLKLNGVVFKKLEVKNIFLRIIIVLSIGTIITIIISYWKYNVLERKVFLLALQIIPVAISEEFWARVGFFKLLQKYEFNTISIIIITSLAFGFLIHFNRPFIDNLIFRFTGGIVLGLTYIITKKAEVPILLHFLNNLLGGL